MVQYKLMGLYCVPTDTLIYTLTVLAHCERFLFFLAVTVDGIHITGGYDTSGQGHNRDADH